MQEGKPGFSAGAEITAEAEMDAREDAVPDISPHILTAQTDHLGSVRLSAVSEEGDHRFGGELHHKDNESAEADGDQRGITKGEPCPLRFARADILRAEGGNSRQHGGWNQEQEADDFFHDPNRGRVVQPSPVSDDGDDDKGDLDQAVLHGDGNPDLQYFSHNRSGRPEIFFFYRQSSALPADDYKRDHDADRLGERGAQGGAGGAQAQDPHKYIIKPDVGGAGRGNKIHGTFAVPHSTENGADDIICRNKRDADKADGQVVYGSGNSSLWGGHHIDNRTDKYEEHDSKRNGQAHEQCDGVANAGRGSFFVFSAHSLPDRDGRTHGEADDHHRQHMHDLRSYRDGRRTGYSLKLPDDKKIRHAVKGLQKVRKQVGERKQQNIFKHAAGCKVFFHSYVSFPQSRLSRPI